jgi:hypothetical protein
MYIFLYSPNQFYFGMDTKGNITHSQYGTGYDLYDPTAVTIKEDTMGIQNDMIVNGFPITVTNNLSKSVNLFSMMWGLSSTPVASNSTETYHVLPSYMPEYHYAGYYKFYAEDWATVLNTFIITGTGIVT